MWNDHKAGRNDDRRNPSDNGGRQRIGLIRRDLVTDTAAYEAARLCERAFRRSMGVTPQRYLTAV